MYGFCDTWYVIDSIAVNAAQDEVPDPWEHEYDETGSEVVVGARTFVVGVELGEDVGIGVERFAKVAFIKIPPTTVLVV